MINKTQITELIEEGKEGPTNDFKEDLPLGSEVDKAKFVKDVVALANSSQIAHIIIGVEDGTWRPIGINTSHTSEKLNQILKDKCDPPISVEYAIEEILHHRIGVIEIRGDNPPYVVAVPDRYGGLIERGTVFVRNFNINQGCSRADLDRIYAAKYATPQADLILQQEVKTVDSGDFMDATIKFMLHNVGEAPAIYPSINITFKNIEKILNCGGGWEDVSAINKGIPMISRLIQQPIYCDIIMHYSEFTIRVVKDTKQIETVVDIQAVGMSRKKGDHTINLESR